MTEEKKPETPKKKGFFARIVETLDEKLKEKAKEKPCCGSGEKGKDSCC